MWLKECCHVSGNLMSSAYWFCLLQGCGKCMNVGLKTRQEIKLTGDGCRTFTCHRPNDVNVCLFKIIIKRSIFYKGIAAGYTGFSHLNSEAVNHLLRDLEDICESDLQVVIPSELSILMGAVFPKALGSTWRKEKYIQHGLKGVENFP